MSSHHIVRDTQEPALLLADFRLCAYPLIEQLLGWSPLVVVLETCLEEVLRWQIKIDAVVFHQQEEESIHQQLAHQLPVSFLKSQGDLYQTALDFLSSKNATAINICDSLSPQAYPPTLKNAQKQFQFVHYDSEKKAYWLPHTPFEKWCAEESVFEFYTEVNELTISNLSQKSSLQWQAKKAGIFQVEFQRDCLVVEYF